MFRKKLNISTFLNVFVSPSASNKELRATTEIKIIEPEKITLVYFNPKLITLQNIVVWYAMLTEKLNI